MRPSHRCRMARQPQLLTAPASVLLRWIRARQGLPALRMRLLLLLLLRQPLLCPTLQQQQ